MKLSDLSNLSTGTKIIGILSALGLVVLVGVGLFFAFRKKDTPTTTPKPPITTPTTTPAGVVVGSGAYGGVLGGPPVTTIPPVTRAAAMINTPSVGKMEVYYADKGGTNATRYMFTTKDEAESHAKMLKGTIATPEQLKNAHLKGMDVCWLGWASDNKIYTVSQRSHGTGSGCEGNSIGVHGYTHLKKAGVWVYGVKPGASQVVNCTTPNAGQCILPFSTTKWSEYS